MREVVGTNFVQGLVGLGWDEQLSDEARVGAQTLGQHPGRATKSVPFRQGRK